MADNPAVGDPNSAEVIFTHPQPYPNHNGGQIEFGPDGNLYIALGDGGSQGDPQNNGQSPDTLLGKILRINVDGDAPYTIPDDNPANTGSTEFAPEVWAMGLRNPYRFSFDRVTGDLYIADVGQSQWEEINFQPANSGGGENYGWNLYEASQPNSGQTAPADMVLPVAEYDHSQGCSVTGGYVYRGAALPDLQGAYLYGDWCSGNIWAAYRDDSNTWQSDLFIDTNYQISGFGEDEQGELYVIAYGGTVFQLTAAQ
jgi:glucose/arabinose dehydrogenase